MKKNSKRIIWILMITFIVLLVLIIMRSRMDRHAENQMALPDINMAFEVRKTDIGDYLEVMGTINAPERIVYGRINGEIESLFIEENQTIEKDATIAIIENTQYRLNYLQAKTAYENSLGGAPKTVEERQLSLQIARQNLANTLINSPVSGFIKTVTVHEGDQINSNSIVCRIVEDQQMYAESFIDEVDLKKVQVGQRVQFVFEPLDSFKTSGYVKEISPIAETSSGIVVIPIEFSFDTLPKGKGVIPGLTCSVNILLMENSNVIIVPLLAVKEDETGSYVYVKNDSEGIQPSRKAEDSWDIRYIETGQVTEHYVEVTDGLIEGEIIIIQADEERLREAMKQLTPSFTGMGGN